ncbi:MAG: Lrp/AsnC family transcriptional regulator [Pseudomonadota bacterium]
MNIAELDRYDLNILKCMQQDASLSTTEIAERVGLSTSPCWRRIKRLIDAGAIKEQVAVLDRTALGMELIAFIDIKLSQHGRENLEHFEHDIKQFPEVLECYTVTGSKDYMLKVVTKDIQHFETFIREHLMRMPMVYETHTTIAVTEVKDTTALPLDTQF